MMGPQNSSTENNSNNNTNLDFDYKDKLNNICSPSNDTKVLQKAYGNGINSNIFNVNTKLCKPQLDFYPSDKVLSSVTKKIYDRVTPPGTMYLNYHSPNAICLITCCRCSLQYFGETVQKLNERFNLHKTGLKHPSKHGHQ